MKIPCVMCGTKATKKRPCECRMVYFKDGRFQVSELDECDKRKWIDQRNGKPR